MSRSSFILALKLALTVVFAFVVLTLLHETPGHIVKVLVQSAVGSRYDLGMTLFYMTPLVFTGLAVALPYRAGLFNIGAEGQLIAGALSAATLPLWFPNLPSPWAPLLGVLAAFLGGALWGTIPGVLKAFRGSHEVITTILLNFIAAGISSWWCLQFIRNPDSQNPESIAIPPAFHLRSFRGFDDAPVGWATVLAVVCAVALYWILRSTRLGYEIQAVGESESAARAGGIAEKKIRVVTMGLAGGCAGLVGVAEVLGNSTRFKVGFSADYGFTGIAVALLARGRPLWVLPAALLMAVLHKSTGDLELETERITRDFALILQALIIVAVSTGFYKFRREKSVPS